MMNSRTILPPHPFNRIKPPVPLDLMFEENQHPFKFMSIETTSRRIAPLVLEKQS